MEKYYNSPKIFTNYKSRIISSNLRKDDYQYWCKNADYKEPNENMHIYYTGTVQALNAVEQGEGIMITHKIIVNDKIKKGDLASLSGFEIEPLDAYYLVYKENNTKIKAVETFRNWLKEQISINY